MTYQFDAIFDNGVIKPLEPVVLPDQSRVRVTVEPAATESARTGSLRSRFGAIGSGDARSADNSRIDADLASESSNPRA
jgi:predicted DNA-binding antitoxin AbrB/MazE fold protein